VSELLSAILLLLAVAPGYRAWRERGYPTLEEL
jgi:hypothetical protein